MEIRKAELGELQELAREELRGVYPAPELRSIIRELFMHITGLSPAQMVLQREKNLSESEIFLLQQAIRRLKRYEPIQYITGKAWFYGDAYHVDPSVLIPRPETEELVAWIIADHKDSKQTLSILDIGTGSGCIAIALRKNLAQADVLAIDISGDALKTARDNASRLEAVVRFSQLDILSPGDQASLDQYHIIVSNPPYVTPADTDRMLPNVLRHEPAAALFAGDDPLLFYRAIVSFAGGHLFPGGKLYLECNESHAGEVANLMGSSGFKEIALKQDMQGKERMVSGKRE